MKMMMGLSQKTRDEQHYLIVEYSFVYMWKRNVVEFGGQWLSFTGVEGSGTKRELGGGELGNLRIERVIGKRTGEWGDEGAWKIMEGALMEGRELGVGDDKDQILEIKTTMLGCKRKMASDEGNVEL
ncbi:unnamed protein product [Calypogeia fissa]